MNRTQHDSVAGTLACRIFTVVLTLGPAFAIQAQEHVPAPPDFLADYCLQCHNDVDWAGSLSFDLLSRGDFDRGSNLVEWEKILRKTGMGEMPPADEAQPPAGEMAEFRSWLGAELDSYAMAHPDPGRATLRRLNRAEYGNAVRDLLALDIDVGGELPADDTGYGFDNIADVLSVSPLLMDRYLSVAGKVSRLAVGVVSDKPSLTSYPVPKDGSIKNSGIPSFNERSGNRLPIDSRGGGSFDYYAPYDGVYEISGYLNANTNNEVDRLAEDRISLRVPLAAGRHRIGMAFRKQMALDESVQTLRNTTDIIVIPPEPPTRMSVDFIVDGARVGSERVDSYHMRARFSQANYLRDVLQIDVEGPFEAVGQGDTPSRRRIFSCRPDPGGLSERECAREILARLARQAYRRPVAAADIEPLLGVFAAVREHSDFEQGIAAGIQAILVSPAFLFLLENDPADSAPGEVHPVSDLEFASRLALFLWSSLPDEELLALAERGRLREPGVLENQLARMLDDPRADALTENFAGQWLYLRNLEFHRADVFLFPEFDTRLRAAMKRETELFFASVLRENRRVADLIQADYSYLNEALAEHYGIEGVSGPAFRRVALDPDMPRGGILGQASILTVTSYGNQTSVVKRGKWILENIFAAPPPAPPPDVPALKTTLNGKQLTAREQMALHRQNPICSSCHVKMDALGFALEQFDAVGKFRTHDAGVPVDASAGFPDGTTFTGLPGLRELLRGRQEEFVHAFTHHLLTYALGRGLEPLDQATVRAIMAGAEEGGYRMHDIIAGIVESVPFNLRRTPQ